MKPNPIYFYDDPLGAMMQQSMWAFNNAIKFQGLPDEQRFIEIHLLMEKEIEKYLKENQAPWNQL